MSAEKLDRSGVITEDRKSSRRDLLKGALIALGAGAILQPNGGVLGAAFGSEPKRKKWGPKERRRKHHGNRGGGRPAKKHGKEYGPENPWPNLPKK